MFDLTQYAFSETPVSASVVLCTPLKSSDSSSGFVLEVAAAGISDSFFSVRGLLSFYRERFFVPCREYGERFCLTVKVSERSAYIFDAARCSDTVISVGSSRRTAVKKTDRRIEKMNIRSFAGRGTFRVLRL